jgi:hypothetical protein
LRARFASHTLRAWQTRFTFDALGSGFALHARRIRGAGRAPGTFVAGRPRGSCGSRFPFGTARAGRTSAAGAASARPRPFGFPGAPVGAG